MSKLPNTILALAFLTSAEAQPQSAESVERAQSIQHIQTLSREIQGFSHPDLAKIPEQYLDDHISQIRKAVQSGVLEALRENDEADSLQKVLGALTAGVSPDAIVYRVAVGGTTGIVAGYSIFYGGAIPSIKVIIDGYRKTGSSSYELAAESGQSLDDCALKLEELISPRPGEAWFFAHGQLHDGMVYKEMMRIYSFDGYKLKELWVPADPKEQPSFEITKDAVIVTYAGENQSVNAFHQPVMRDTVRLTPDGPVASTLIAAP